MRPIPMLSFNTFNLFLVKYSLACIYPWADRLMSYGVRTIMMSRGFELAFRFCGKDSLATTLLLTIREMCFALMRKRMSVPSRLCSNLRSFHHVQLFFNVTTWL